MAPTSSEAVFATLLMNDAYLPGAMVLGHSLKDRGAKGKLVALVVIEKLGPNTISDLQTVYDDIVPVQQITNKAPANLYLMNRPDLISAFTKIQLWRQTQYKRIVYIDADCVALRAPNELLTMDTEFAAVPDIGWPDCFNSGVMVLNPNMADYYSLLALAERGISFDGADQGLLNMHFTEWERLSFTYNCTPSGNYQYVPAYRHFQSSINLVHFIGRDKPWTLGRYNKYSSGVYGELLARWWSVYDRHYRAREVIYSDNAWQQAPKKVQDYVAGEETLYLPASQAPPPVPHSTPSVVIHHGEVSTNTAEQSMGDQPSVDEQINRNQYEPTPTAEQRRWSAPHVDWEPARAPPPVDSKPEASNFPSQTYEFSEDVKLFRPPVSYPEAPKDMWYEVPAKVEPVQQKPKPIFPWELHAPKPTRVFVDHNLSSPPIQPAASTSRAQPAAEHHVVHQVLPEVSAQGAYRDTPQASSQVHTQPHTQPHSQPHMQPYTQPYIQPQAQTQTQNYYTSPTASTSATPHKAQTSTKSTPPFTSHSTSQTSQPPPTVSRSFTSHLPQTLPKTQTQQRSQPRTEKTDTPPAMTNLTDATDNSIVIPREPWMNPWEAFKDRSNAWDDMPEISAYVQALQPPKRGKIQVLHHTPSTGDQERRGSIKITDFPTETERPSLPVTPAPIRRPTFWGDDNDLTGELPNAEGVPKQDEWVRRFSSYPTPAFTAVSPLVHESDGTLWCRCQYCGKQNPIAKLAELQRRQSEVLVGKGDPQDVKDPPKRDLPDSASLAAVEAAVERTSPTSVRPLKPILKEPKFELGLDANDNETKSMTNSIHDSVAEAVLSPSDIGEEKPSTTPTATLQMSA